MIQEIVAFLIVIIALVITVFFFRKKYLRIKKNQEGCGTCDTSSCEGCALTKINEAKKRK